MIYVGTAAWSLPKEVRHEFAKGDSLLQSYASRLSGVEINSSFYKEHQAKTYLRWAETVPDHFRFSVKLAREFTHHGKLKLDKQARVRLKEVLQGYQALETKLGCLLIQLPPSLEWREKLVSEFFLVHCEIFTMAL